MPPRSNKGVLWAGRSPSELGHDADRGRSIPGATGGPRRRAGGHSGCVPGPGAEASPRRGRLRSADGDAERCLGDLARREGARTVRPGPEDGRCTAHTVRAIRGKPAALCSRSIDAADVASRSLRHRPRLRPLRRFLTRRAGHPGSELPRVAGPDAHGPQAPARDRDYPDALATGRSSTGHPSTGRPPTDAAQVAVLAPPEDRNVGVLARPAGLEPATSRSATWRSIH